MYASKLCSALRCSVLSKPECVKESVTTSVVSSFCNLSGISQELVRSSSYSMRAVMAKPCNCVTKVREAPAFASVALLPNSVSAKSGISRNFFTIFLKVSSLFFNSASGTRKVLISKPWKPWGMLPECSLRYRFIYAVAPLAFCCRSLMLKAEKKASMRDLKLFLYICNLSRKSLSWGSSIIAVIWGAVDVIMAWIAAFHVVVML
mmetsp:Transcript_35505/g.81282  ORF Transcript_35505/g.81282 Transcript_35505/m.81282 type:complete len:205 (-) Transcript_35505:472-1086(-)